MWPMIAESGLRCSECRHTIQLGRLCLSELPEELPTGVSPKGGEIQWILRSFFGTPPLQLDEGC